MQPAVAQTGFGTQGVEAELNGQWQVPSPDPQTAAHAVPFRPPGDGPFPLVLIAQASPRNVLRRAQMPQPEFRLLPASGSEGHWLAEIEAGAKSAEALERALKPAHPAAARKR
jgi:hypothetical protein